MQDKIAKIFFIISGTISIVVVSLIVLFISKEALFFVKSPGITELFGNRWMPVSFVKESFGIFPLILGSFLITGLATIIAVPLGICAAIYIAEMTNNQEREILKPIVELLAGIPSVVLGFFGLVVLAPIVKKVFGLNSGLTALTGAIVLAFMAIPTIVSISEDAIRNVPISLKQASLALGANRLQTILKVIVPAALPGIIAATLLGIGRVIGETMAVLMVTGNAAMLTVNPFESVRTMTATIAAEMGEVPFGGEHYLALFMVAVVLLLFTFFLNLIAQKILKKYRFEV